MRFINVGGVMKLNTMNGKKRSDIGKFGKGNPQAIGYLI
jgi:hypothetical protein